MVKSQRMRVANEKASKNVVLRGNVPKGTVSIQSPVFHYDVGHVVRMIRNFAH